MSAAHPLAPTRLAMSGLLGAAAFVAMIMFSVAEAQQSNSYPETRISQFERSVKDLRNRLEQLRQQNQHLQQEADRVRISHDKRLQLLEKGATTTPPKSRPAKP